VVSCSWCPVVSVLYDDTLRPLSGWRDTVCDCREKATRLQYYLQLRDNLLHYNQSVTEEKCFLLAGLALQADFGNFDHDRHIGAYFDPREFFPAWVSQPVVSLLLHCSINGIEAVS